MPTPSSVKIDEKSIPDVEWVEFTYETPTEQGGYLSNATPYFGLIKLKRLATNNPMADLFALATNNDGTQRKFNGEITLVDNENETTYSVSFKKAFVEQWTVRQTHSNLPGEETVVLRVEQLTFHAGSENESVDFKNYGK